ncbi:MAG TPA: hypothetical protein PK838_08370 [Thermoleophilia bacterium]|nr:hypothetical protein [Thermoleophilia bacterium]
MERLEILKCEWCGRILDRPKRGPAPRFCGAACRQSSSRARREAAVVRAELERGSQLVALAEHAEPVPAACVDEQVARAYAEAQTLAGVFARLGAQVRPEFAWRCTRVAEALADVISETLQGRD